MLRNNKRRKNEEKHDTKKGYKLTSSDLSFLCGLTQIATL